MIERELAWRVFAHEFNHSDYFFHEGDERAPNYLVTPTGAKINRLYFVGVLTEMDNIGVGEDMWRGRLSDPTGAFTVYAGQYQPEAAVFLAGLDIPSFVAVVGKARIYEPEKGTFYTSVRPEELNNVEAFIRDRWIVDTARLTSERIRLVQRAKGSGLQGEDLTAMLVQSGVNQELASGISMAIDHYSDLDSYLDSLSAVVLKALRTLLPGDDLPLKKDTITEPQVQYHTGSQAENDQVVDAGSVGSQVNEEVADYSLKEPVREPDADEIIYELLGMLDTGKGVPVAELIERSISSGLNEDQIDEAVKTLMSEGKCYEPRIGLLRRV